MAKLGRTAAQALSRVAMNRATFDDAEKRACAAGVQIDATFVKTVYEGFDELSAELQASRSTDGIDSVIDRSKILARLRAYVYPPKELQFQANAALQDMREWEVPSTVLDPLVAEITTAMTSTDEQSARAALARLLYTHDDWDWYVNHYFLVIRRMAYVLFGLMLIVVSAGLWFLVRGAALKGFLCAGLAGALVSVIAKLPPLTVWGDMAEYSIRILRRVGTGLGASLIGWALLSSNVVTITVPNTNSGPNAGPNAGSISITEMIRACATETYDPAVPSAAQSADQSIVPMADLGSPLGMARVTTGLGRVRDWVTMPPSQAARLSKCTTPNVLILFGIAMLLGFSERALTSFEDKVFPAGSTAQKKDQTNDSVTRITPSTSGVAPSAGTSANSGHSVEIGPAAPAKDDEQGDLGAIERADAQG